MTGSPGATNGLLGQAQKAGQEQAHNHQAEKTQGPPGLLHQSHAAAQERGEEQQLAQKLPDESWVEFVLRMRQPPPPAGGGSDGNEPARERSLPDEEKDQSRGR